MIVAKISILGILPIRHGSKADQATGIACIVYRQGTHRLTYVHVRLSYAIGTKWRRRIGMITISAARTWMETSKPDGNMSVGDTRLDQALHIEPHAMRKLPDRAHSAPSEFKCIHLDRRRPEGVDRNCQPPIRRGVTTNLSDSTRLNFPYAFF